MFSERTELFNTIESESSGIAMGKGIWKWDQLKEEERVVGLRCIVKGGQLRGLAFSVWSPK